MVRAARALLVSTASFAVVLAAIGWLYVIQPHASLPGPPVDDALPLDELSRRSAVPLLVFLVVWAAAAALLAFVAHAGRAERLTAGLLLALGVGGWMYLQTGVSLLIVRQIPAHEAFHAATGQRAVYLPALLAGIAGALGGRARASGRPRSPLVLAWFVAAAGLLGVIDAVTADHRTALIGAVAPEQVHGISEALVAPLGLALLVAARGLARRKRRAWQLAVVILLFLVALHLQHRFGYGAIATALVAVALLARRSDFDAPGDPEAQPRLAVRALLLAVAIFAYGFVALWLNRVMADQPFTLPFALRETGAGRYRRERQGLGPSLRDVRRVVPSLRPAAERVRRRPPAGELARALALPPRARGAPPPPDARPRHGLGSRHARAVRAARRQVVLLRRRRGGLRRLQGRRRRRDRVRRSDRPAGSVRGARRSLPQVRAVARLASRDPRRVRARARGLSRARPARPLPRRRGGGRDGSVLARGQADPQGPPVGAPVATHRLRR
jgi:hypothetical protein